MRQVEVLRGRTRRKIAGEIVELDVISCPIERWDELLAGEPELRNWSTVRFEDVVLAVEPFPLNQLAAIFARCLGEGHGAPSLYDRLSRRGAN